MNEDRDYTAPMRRADPPARPRSELDNLNLSLLNALTRREGHTSADTRNVVDGLFAIAAALGRLADVAERVAGEEGE